MDHAAVVPHQQHARLPAVAVDEVLAHLVVEQLHQQRLRFVVGHALDADGVAGADDTARCGRSRDAPARSGASAWPARCRRSVMAIERPLSRLAVHAVARIAAARRVDALLVLQQRLHRRRQRVPGGVLVGEQRVAAHRRNDVAVQQRGLRRHAAGSSSPNARSRRRSGSSRRHRAAPARCADGPARCRSRGRCRRGRSAARCVPGPRATGPGRGRPAPGAAARSGAVGPRCRPPAARAGRCPARWRRRARLAG